MRANKAFAAAAMLGAGLIVSACGSGGGGPGTTPLPATASTSQSSGTAAVPPVTGVAGRTITVVGTGSVTAKPDVAAVTLGVTMTGAKVSDAVSAAATASTTLVNTLVAAGVSRDDIATTQYTVGPHWEPNLGRNVGWEVRDGFTAVIHDVSRVGNVVASASAALPNVFWVQDVRLDRADTTSIAGPARDAAVKDARARAAAWAQLAGVQLGDIVSVSEQNASSTYTVPSQGVGSGGGIVTGTGRLTLTVTVVFAVK